MAGSVDDLGRNLARTAEKYDALPYVSRPFAETHPARLSAIARLFGLVAPAVGNARVLELGCAAGGNLIPMAAHHPEATFVGVDLGGKQVQDGSDRIARLGLANIEIRQQSITDIGPDDGAFDYIICHGVYSWVPDPVREAILRTCGRNLSAGGIAYISFNVSPGWCLYQPLREAFRSMIPANHDETTRVTMARQLLEFMKQNSPDKGPYGDMLRASPARLAGLGDDYIFHEYMEDENSPCTFNDFAKAAAGHGLGYLADSHVQMMLPENFGSAFAQALRANTTNDVVSQEQMIDVLTGRTFRQTLLVRQEQMDRIDRRLRPEALRGLHFVGPKALKLANDGSAISLTDETGRTLTTREDAVGPVLERLVKAYPSSMAFSDCLSDLSGREREVVAEAIFRLVIAGIVDITTEPVSLAEPGAHPQADELARSDARVGSTMTTNRRHEGVKLDPAAVELLPHLDGSNDHRSLEKVLLAAALAGRITFRHNGVPVNEPRPLREAVAGLLPRILDNLAQSGLITG
ncbi:MAG: class I SAM-dependent methyltransferase [Novosphingobium sp.]|nr:class I SAM-dependent methyltransferase [Novosphingobium sp.]